MYIYIFEDSIKNKESYKIIYDNYIYNYKGLNSIIKRTLHCHNDKYIIYE